MFSEISSIELSLFDFEESGVRVLFRVTTEAETAIDGGDAVLIDGFMLSMDEDLGEVLEVSEEGIEAESGREKVLVGCRSITAAACARHTVGLGFQPDFCHLAIGRPPGRTGDLAGRPQELEIRESGRTQKRADLRPDLAQPVHAHRSGLRTVLQIQIDSPGRQMGMVHLELELERLGYQEL